MKVNIFQMDLHSWEYYHGIVLKYFDTDSIIKIRISNWIEVSPNDTYIKDKFGNELYEGDVVVYEKLIKDMGMIEYGTGKITKGEGDNFFVKGHLLNSLNCAKMEGYNYGSKR